MNTHQPAESYCIIKAGNVLEISHCVLSDGFNSEFMDSLLVAAIMSVRLCTVYEKASPQIELTHIRLVNSFDGQLVSL